MNRALKFTYRTQGQYPFADWSVAARRVPLRRAANTFVANDDFWPVTDGDTA